MKGPSLVWRLILTLRNYFRCTVYHYIEYEYFGSHYHTRRSGPLNDLEGNGLLCEVKKRGGRITVHKEGPENQIAEIIAQRAEQIANWQSTIINQPKSQYRKL